MRLDKKLLLLFVAVLLLLARMITVSSRRAIHSVLVANLEAAARAQQREIIRSFDVGMQPGNQHLLYTYLHGCLGGFSASYAAAVGEDGAVEVVENVAALTRVPGERYDGWRKPLTKPVSRESTLAGGPVLELFFPGARGGLLLGFSLQEVLRTEREIAMKIFLFTGVSGGLTLLLLVLLTRDLGRREDQLRQTEKLSALGRLAAGIAHEINNPLGSILGFAQAASARLKPSDALLPPLQAIEEEALRCRNIVQNLLTFSRHSDGDFEEFDLALAVEGTLSMIETQARVQGVTIVREMADGLLANGDRGQIQQVVMNLCTNAVDAMPKGGRLTIRSGPLKEGLVFLEVQDEGPGIPPGIRDKIFEPFFTTKEVGQGTGLGLSLVHEIVVRHKGSIEARAAPGHGALFNVTLPGHPPRAK